MPTKLRTIAQVVLIALVVAWAAIGSWHWHSSPGQPSTFWPWLTQDAAGFFALLLVIVGVGQLVLFWRQLRLIRESLVDAKQAADAATQGAKAAETNAQALIDAESAKVYVVDLDSNIARILHIGKHHTPPPDAEMFEPPWIQYRLKNYGKSPALIINALHGFSLTNVNELPHGFSLAYGKKLPLDRFKWASWNRAMEIVGVGQESNPIKCEYDGPFTSEDAKSIVTPDALLTFYGVAIFLDTFGREHCLDWEFLAYDGGWQLIDHRETRKEPSA
jgi:hypothetical protein